MSRTGNRVYRIEDVEVDTLQGCIRKNGTEVHLRHKTFQVLIYLLEQRHRLVTKEELWENVWPDVAVTDDALSKCVADIRKALGDNAREQRLLKTVSKSGYRFVGPVAEETVPSAISVVETEITTYEVEIDDAADLAVSASNVEDRLQTVAPAALLSSRRRSNRLTPVLIGGILLALIAGYAAYRLSRPARSSTLDLTLGQSVGKKSIAVMYLNNQSGASELDWLREGLADMLINNLSRSKKLAVLNREQLHLVLERNGYNGSDAIDLNQALEIARQSKAEVILLGSFAKLDEAIRIDLQLYDGRDGKLLFAEHLTTDKQSQMLSQIDLLSLKIANQLGASEETEKPAAGTQAITNNLEAYRYYSLALEKMQGMDNTGAIDLLNKATVLDPEFAMAYARIGYAYGITWDKVAQARPYFEKAFQLSNRLSEKDKLHVTAWYAINNFDWPRAIQTIQEIIKIYPLEVEAYLQLGRLLQGELRYDEAVDVLRRGLAIDSQGKDLYNTIGSVYAYEGNHEQAIAAHRQYVALAPTLPNSHDSLGMSLQWAGRYKEAEVEYNQALALNPDFDVARVHLGNLYYQEGYYKSAVEQFRRYIEVAPGNLERARGLNSLSFIYWRQKDYPKALQSAEAAHRYDSSQSTMQVVLFVDQKQFVKAQTTRDVLERLANTNRGRRAGMRNIEFLRGYTLLKQGQVDSAIEAFKSAIRQAPAIHVLDSREDALADAYMEVERFDDAIAEFNRVLKLNANYPLVHFKLAQIFERRLETDKARREYEEFLRIWSDADQDIPEIIAAREKLKQ